MFCSNCGQEITSDAAFCPECGNAVKFPKSADDNISSFDEGQASYNNQQINDTESRKRS